MRAKQPLLRSTCAPHLSYVPTHSDLNHCPRHRGADQPTARFPNLNRTPEQLPDPWLFDSEKLLRELDRCREMILLVPVNGDPHATHFGINNAISAIWNLREQLRYLLSLHRDGQRAFAKRADSLETPRPSTVSKRTLRHERPKRA
jgi:hypothetical protein